jgi:hypothetical protein
MKTIVIVPLVAAGLLVWPVSAQERSLRADRTVEFRTGRAHTLNVTVGPVKVESVEFSDLGRVAGANESEASTTLRARFMAENPTTDDWVVRFTLEFLDKAGAVIEKVSKSAGWEGEAKPYNLEHPILSYVVPLIARVRINFEARLD